MLSSLQKESTKKAQIVNYIIIIIITLDLCQVLSWKALIIIYYTSVCGTLSVLCGESMAGWLGWRDWNPSVVGSSSTFIIWLFSVHISLAHCRISLQPFDIYPQNIWQLLNVHFWLTRKPSINDFVFISPKIAQPEIAILEEILHTIHGGIIFYVLVIGFSSLENTDLITNCR